MEFVTFVNPAQKRSTASKESKRQAHSHAARVAHARTRRARTARYMQEKGIDQRKSKTKASETDPTFQAVVAQHRHSQPSDEVLPLSTTVPGAFEHEPLASFLKSLTFKERFLFYHYVQVVFPYLDHHCPVLPGLGQYHGYMRYNWILFSSADVDLLRGFLLAACRHLSIVHQVEEYTQLAIQYKLQYVRSLRETLSAHGTRFRGMAVTRALVLGLDEIMLRDLSMASKHVRGAAEIVQIAGGPKALGLSDFVYHILCSCVDGKRLLDWNSMLHSETFCGSTFMMPERVPSARPS